jgi:hypothetical protein
MRRNLVRTLTLSLVSCAAVMWLSGEPCGRIALSLALALASGLCWIELVLVCDGDLALRAWWRRVCSYRSSRCKR